MIRSGAPLINSVSLTEWCMAQDDGQYVLTVTDCRTNDQNRLFHQLVKEYKMMCFKWFGQRMSNKEAKLQFKLWIGFFTPFKARAKNGAVKMVPLPKESSKLSKKAFSELMIDVKEKWMSDFKCEPVSLMPESIRHYFEL